MDLSWVKEEIENGRLNASRSAEILINNELKLLEFSVTKSGSRVQAHFVPERHGIRAQENLKLGITKDGTLTIHQMNTHIGVILQAKGTDMRQMDYRIQNSHEDTIGNGQFTAVAKKNYLTPEVTNELVDSMRVYLNNYKEGKLPEYAKKGEERQKLTPKNSESVFWSITNTHIVTADSLARQVVKELPTPEHMKIATRVGKLYTKIKSRGFKKVESWEAVIMSMKIFNTSTKPLFASNKYKDYVPHMAISKELVGLGLSGGVPREVKTWSLDRCADTARAVSSLTTDALNGAFRYAKNN